MFLGIYYSAVHFYRRMHVHNWLYVLPCMCAMYSGCIVGVAAHR